MIICDNKSPEQAKKLLLAVIQKNKLSHEAIAKLSGSSQRAISRFLRNPSNTSARTAVKIYAFLNITISESEIKQIYSKKDVKKNQEIEQKKQTRKLEKIVIAEKKRLQAHKRQQKLDAEKEQLLAITENHKDKLINQQWVRS